MPDLIAEAEAEAKAKAGAEADGFLKAGSWSRTRSRNDKEENA